MKIYRVEPANPEHPLLMGTNPETLKARVRVLAQGEEENAFPFWDEEEFPLTEQGVCHAISWGAMPSAASGWEWVN